ncbi:unnamed protein product [Agarophyton chilense]
MMVLTKLLLTGATTLVLLATLVLRARGVPLVDGKLSISLSDLTDGLFTSVSQYVPHSSCALLSAEYTRILHTTQGMRMPHSTMMVDGMRCGQLPPNATDEQLYTDSYMQLVPIDALRDEDSARAQNAYNVFYELMVQSRPIPRSFLQFMQRERAERALQTYVGLERFAARECGNGREMVQLARGTVVFFGSVGGKNVSISALIDGVAGGRDVYLPPQSPYHVSFSARAAAAEGVCALKLDWRNRASSTANKDDDDDDDKDDDKGGNARMCFPAAATVVMAKSGARRRMEALRVGDVVRARSHGGGDLNSAVFALSHADGATHTTMSGSARAQALGDDNESLHAYIAATHQTLFAQFSALVFGDATVAKAAFRGALAVQGRAELSHFDIGADQTCDVTRPTLLVRGALVARAGALHGGHAVVGARSRLHHSVQRTCSQRVEAYDAVHTAAHLDFDAARRAVLRETAELCVAHSSGHVTLRNDTLLLTPRSRARSVSCYALFHVRAADLRLARRWRLLSPRDDDDDQDDDDQQRWGGRSAFRNVVLVVSGMRAELRDVRMRAFNARRTLLVFCAVYGTLDMYNVKLRASVLAPTASLTAMDSVVNGSLVVGGLRGSLAALHAAYATC